MPDVTVSTWYSQVRPVEEKLRRIILLGPRHHSDNSGPQKLESKYATAREREIVGPVLATVLTETKKLLR